MKDATRNSDTNIEPIAKSHLDTRTPDEEKNSEVMFYLGASKIDAALSVLSAADPNLSLGFYTPRDKHREQLENSALMSAIIAELIDDIRHPDPEAIQTRQQLVAHVRNIFAAIRDAKEIEMQLASITGHVAFPCERTARKPQ